MLTFDLKDKYIFTLINKVISHVDDWTAQSTNMTSSVNSVHSVHCVRCL